MVVRFIRVGRRSYAVEDIWGHGSVLVVDGKITATGRKAPIEAIYTALVVKAQGLALAA